MPAQKKCVLILKHFLKRALGWFSLKRVLLARSLLNLPITVDLPEISLNCGSSQELVLATYQGKEDGSQEAEEEQQAQSRDDREAQEEGAQVAKYQPAFWPRFRGHLCGAPESLVLTGSTRQT